MAIRCALVVFTQNFYLESFSWVLCISISNISMQQQLQVVIPAIWLQKCVGSRLVHICIGAGCGTAPFALSFSCWLLRAQILIALSHTQQTHTHTHTITVRLCIMIARCAQTQVHFICVCSIALFSLSTLCWSHWSVTKNGILMLHDESTSNKQMAHHAVVACASLRF